MKIDDKFYMKLAIDEAWKYQFLTYPNPAVACVVVKNGEILSIEAHTEAGLPHAEVNALAMAKERVLDATCYVTLEPCSHFGRTPPCALALVKAGVKRVVIAMVDPNPKVAGRGITLLEEAGITVDVGLLTELNEPPVPLMILQVPLSPALDPFPPKKVEEPHTF